MENDIKNKIDECFVEHFDGVNENLIHLEIKPIKLKELLIYLISKINSVAEHVTIVRNSADEQIGCVINTLERVSIRIDKLLDETVQKLTDDYVVKQQEQIDLIKRVISKITKEVKNDPVENS